MARMRISIKFTPLQLAIPLLLIGGAGGFMQAGVDGLTAGVFAATMATLLSITGIVPVAGQIAYWYMMEMVKQLIGIDLGIVWTVIFWLGAAMNVLTSVAISMIIALWIRSRA